jgi:hypothetical protein
LLVHRGGVIRKRNQAGPFDGSVTFSNFKSTPLVALGDPDCKAIAATRERDANGKVRSVRNLKRRALVAIDGPFN